MKRMLFIGLLAFMSSNVFAQELKDTIETRKTFWGPLFLRYRYPLTQRELKEIMQSNREAYRPMKTAQVHYVISQIAAITGGMILTLALSASIKGEGEHWVVYAVGTGLIAAAIPFVIANGKYSKKAVRIYNEKLRQGK